jgi:hypothetical protein
MSGYPDVRIAIRWRSLGQQNSMECVLDLGNPPGGGIELRAQVRCGSQFWGGGGQSFTYAASRLPRSPAPTHGLPGLRGAAPANHSRPIKWCCRSGAIGLKRTPQPNGRPGWGSVTGPSAGEDETPPVFLSDPNNFVKSRNMAEPEPFGRSRYIRSERLFNLISICAPKTTTRV